MKVRVPPEISAKNSFSAATDYYHGLLGQFADEFLNVTIDAVHFTVVVSEVGEIEPLPVQCHFPDSPEHRMEESKNLRDICLERLTRFKIWTSSD